MDTYIVLGRFTDEGAKNLQNFGQAIQENRERALRLGLELKGWYLTQGQYDFVIIAEAPNGEAMVLQALGVATAGLSRSETLRAWPLDEAQDLLQRIS